ncbi:hypothetical protein MA16_Dca002296 [Dendrobium catenatum]|uniref:DUF3741 domain-containing protein n=1 Tax=Dendrobium catenatum TaxID=906689 RepID=A0A2I0W057_9ASPA|nr:hypothetical protein MA16_Dca002296 [Dendrobium catenatum]
MINLFDLSTGMAGTKKAFRDGSIGGRNRPVVGNKAIDPVEIHSEDKPVTCESRKSSSGKKTNTTPMKTLIAQEMSKEMDLKRKTPNVIARLMGLDDTLPVDPSVVSTKRNLLDGGCVQSNLEVRGFQDSQQRQVGYLNRLKPQELQSYCNENKDYRDVYEIRQQSSRSNSLNNQARQKGLHYENRNDKRMALVREKFIEAKRLATDEKLLESKEFHDALEVLSSNRDLFLKFLEEPNSLFSSQSEEHHSIPSPPQTTKRITVLKPSKAIETKSKVKHQYESGSELQNTLWNSGFAYHPEKLPQPTRIVVLKPSPKKHLDLKSPATSFMSSPEPPRKGDGNGVIKTRDPIGPREADKDIKLQTPENLSRHRRDESLLSSVFSNGYVGDDSSFNRSENFVGEDCNNSDSEIASSWDYMSNRYGSPYSHSSLSRASHSPESSLVIKEAKKRLSERWALVTSNGLYQEKLQGRRSSSTLGEMLSINELKMENRNDMGPGASGIRSKEENGDGGSSEIPLDPKLLDKLSDTKEEVVKTGERSSNQKLIFDCVNHVLQEIGHSAEQGAYQSTKVCCVAEDETLLAEQVWPVVKNRLSGGESWTVGEAVNGSLVVEKLLGREVKGTGWSELLLSEIATISKEIGEQVFDELIGEALLGMNKWLSRRRGNCASVASHFVLAESQCHPFLHHYKFS